MAINMPGKDVSVRLVSYLTRHPELPDQTYVLGLVEGFRLVLRHLSLANDKSTIFLESPVGGRRRRQPHR